MAENIDLNIKIGANVTDLQAELQKAENLLKQFEAALKKATNVGEINYLNGQIKNLNTTISSLGQQMNKVGRPAADATNALTNLSRVAQDAPYGFIGIANNLNPLLESFQRLSKESGSAGGALKSMVAGLTGPAGVGIALGVVSSLVVAFGDDIGNFITEKMQGLGEAFTVESNLIKESSSAFVKATTDIDKLKNSFDLFEQGSITKEKFLKEFNSTLGDTISKTNDLATAERFLTEYADTYIEMTFKKAIATEASAQAAKKMLELEISKGAALSPSFGGALSAIFGNPAMIGVKAAESKLAIQSGLQAQIDLLKSLRKKYDEEAKLLQLSLTNTFGTADNTSSTNTNSKEVDYAREENKALELELAKMKALREKFNKLNLKPIIEVYNPETDKEEDKRKGFFQNKAKENLNESNKSGLGDFLQKDSKKRLAAYKLEDEKLEQLKKSQEDFASSISQNVTGALFGMYDAMQEGATASQALGDMFSKLLRQMAEMVVQAILFQAIMSALGLSGAGGAAGGGKSFLGGIGKILGLADGGLATGPTLAMIGEGNESEAVLPLSKLGNIMQSSFNAGSMSGTSRNSGGQFVLRGQDLLLATNRAQKSSNLKGQSISLA
jgi:hypothetical protein